MLRWFIASTRNWRNMSWGQGTSNNDIGWGQGSVNDDDIGWGEIYADSWSGDTNIIGLASDAAAYFTAASIVDATEQAAVIQLVKDLKGTGSTTNNTDVWSDLLTLYPISPTSLAAAAFNLIDPSSYEITWYNSPTHGDDGIESDGSTSYGDSGYQADNSVDNDVGLTVAFEYPPGGGTPLGARDTTGDDFYLMMRGASNTRRFYAGENTEFVTGGSDLSTAVFTGIRRAADDKELYKNGASVGTNTNTDSNGLPALNLFVLASNQDGSPAQYMPSGINTNFLAAHTALSDNQIDDLYDAITTYNANVVSGGR